MSKNNTKTNCEICRFENPKMTAAAVIVRDGKVLVVKRNKPPEMGKWDFVGGFLNKGESPEDGLKREVFEETKCQIEEYDFLGFSAGTYKYNKQTFPIMEVSYLVRIKNNKIFLDEENSGFKWMNIKKIKNIAFESGKKTLKKLKDMAVSYGEAKELIKQLDATADVKEFNFYRSQLNGYLSKEYDGKKLIGMGWIFPRQTALRKQAVIEDMIVDEKYRGRGLGKKIVLDLINWAKKNEVEVIELTSNSKRIAANELYKSVGFKPHPTNHYLLDLR